MKPYRLIEHKHVKSLLGACVMSFVVAQLLAFGTLPFLFRTYDSAGKEFSKAEVATNANLEVTRHNIHALTLASDIIYGIFFIFLVLLLIEIVDYYKNVPNKPNE